MVPVEVERARVQVDRDRLETVVKPELEAREMHGKVARDFEVNKLEIEAQEEIRVATAQATASLFSKMEAKLFGTPEEVNKLLGERTLRTEPATAANAFSSTTDPKTASMVAGLARGLGGLAEAPSKKLTDGRSSKPSGQSDTEIGNGVASTSDDIAAVDADAIEVSSSQEGMPEAPAA